MSRHRNVRALDADEEYDSYYSCYGHSVEEDFCISPQTEAQFLYNRSQNQSMDAYLKSKGDAVPEEDETYEDNSEHSLPDHDQKWSSLDNAKLQSCIEAMQDVVGDTISEAVLRKAAIDHKFDLEKALNAVLLDNAPKPQRRTAELSSCKVIQKDNKQDINVEILSEKQSTNSCSVNDSRKAKFERNTVKSEPQINEKTQPSKINNSEVMAIADEKPETEVEKILQSKNEKTQPSKINNSEVMAIADEKTETEVEKILQSKSQKSSQNVEEIYKKERGSEKTCLNLVVVGHVDAGKSTLMGHILYKLGQVSKKAMHKFEQESKKLGKSSFMYAWVLDETPEERNRGITMDVAQTRFETPSKSIILLDAPGHKDFIPNMITGAAQADAAILVVDSTNGEFETGFEAGGQTREHTMLIRSLGVSQLVIAVNKMDNNNWSQERFLEIKSKLISFLKTVGYKEGDATFVPCSGLTGENLTSPAESPELKNWYSGPTIVDVIDNFQPPERPICKPMRMCINDVFKGITGGYCLAGRVESGCITTGDKVLVMPAGEQGTVKSIMIDDQVVQHSFAGESIIIQINGIDINNVATGSMVCDVDRPIKVSSNFEARLVIFNVAIPITRGFPVVLHYQSMCEQAIIKKLVSQLNRSTGEVIRKKPRCLTKNSSAVVEIEVNRPICMELFRDFKGLGRFMLRYAGSTIAAGLVTSLK